MNILLADDDTSIIQSLLPILNGIPGAQVRAATTGAKAIENAEALGSLDVLVSDVVMEPMDGFTLRDELLTRFRDMKTVFVTGYDLSDYPDQTNGHIVLMKPVDADALRNAVAECAKAIAQGRPAPVAIPVPSVSASPAIPKISAPTATPAQFTAVPTPAAKPSVLPLPTATPSATPVAKVSTTPQGTPSPISSPQPTATPRATPSPTPTATPSAVSVARPAGAPRATPSAAVPVAKAASAASPPVPAESDSLEGTTLGVFQIVRKLGDGRWGPVYEAVQTTMGRPVAMNLLKPELAQDPESKRQFIANASAKANVQHPLILSVYEAGEISGTCYYTHEFVDGMNIEQLAERGVKIGEPEALQVVKTITEALSYLAQAKVTHSALHSRHIYVGAGGRSSLANLATYGGDHQPPVQEEIMALSRIVCSVLPEEGVNDPGLQSMLARMQTPGAQGYQSWVALMQTVKGLEPKVVPADAFQLSQQDVAAIRAVEEARKRQRRTLILNLIGIGALLLTVGGVFYWKFLYSPLISENMIKIPAGEFIYQDGEKKTLPDFWIDEYEVTIGQYAKFLEYLERNPTTQFDHPNQPANHSHEPDDWIVYYERAKHNEPVRGFQTISLNSPALTVDWWDAYAYAKWLGRRLPTEEEWEKAARGEEGYQYPWGNEFDGKKVNSKEDHQPFVRSGEGAVDGWNYWSPVDAVVGDASPYGVKGMAGNVREWTASWDKSGKFPIIRGGSYESPSSKATYRVADQPSTTRQEWLGFRTASSTPPE